MEWLKKITDFIMPPIDPPEEEPEKVESSKSVAAAKEPEKKIESITKTAVGAAEPAVESQVGEQTAMAGASFGYGSSLKFNAEGTPSVRPPLTVVESKVKELNVKIYNPTKYEQALTIAAEILGKNAAVVNYEYVESSVQLRICDYLNGVCYVTDGFTDKISEKIFLYVPAGVDTVDIAEAVSAVNNNQFRRGMFAN